MPTLFDPVRLGALELGNRIVMAPLTRARATADRIPTDVMRAYYEQRASAGLILTEATIVTPKGAGYAATPGIYSAAQVEAWKPITEAVHRKGGKIVMQLWHVGRISDPSLLDGDLPVAPSALQPAGHVSLLRPMRPYPTPRALDIDELPGIIEAYRKGAENAREAGFDGVEIHGANGYLIEQFLQSRSNRRDDIYGGPVENRTRLLFEVAEAVTAVWGPERVGVRLSPWGIANDSGEENPEALYGHAIAGLAARRISYLHLIEPRASGAGRAEVDRPEQPLATAVFRPRWPGVLIGAGNYTRDSAMAAVAGGTADAVAFGRAFIANPDLPRRLELGAALNPYNRPTFYGGGAEGYTDYPALEPEVA